MSTRKVRAATMRDALFQVKKELGSDAVIMRTRSARTRGFFGFGCHPFVEIEAATAAHARAATAAADDSPAMQFLTQQIRKARSRMEGGCELDMLKNDISWIKSTLDDIARRGAPAALPAGGCPVPEELTGMHAYLLEQECAVKLAQQLIDQVAAELRAQGLTDRRIAAEILRGYLAQVFCRCEPIRLSPGTCTRVALIGPTGVGKTKTIAKLAATFALLQKRKVSVITIDTYRIAAVEQLKTFMDIINVPLEVVNTTEQMRKAVKRHEKSDCILIDTAGRSQRNTQQLADLKEYIEAAAPHEVHLVVSATAAYANAMEIINKFSVVPVDKLLFTKLDEAVHYGVLANIALRCSRPISYITTGQSVPDDFECAQPQRLADRMLGEYRYD